jgi:uncharacterized protein YbjT (DUF2867 family)
MDLLGPALRGARHAVVREPGAARGLVVIGAGGTLGSAVLEQLLGQGAFHPVWAVVREPIASTARGLRAVHAVQPEQLALEGVATAMLVFERERHSNGRDDAFVQPQPAELQRWASALRSCGVQRLLVVLPHAPAMLPQALRHGFASEQEQALTALGLEQVLLLRPAQLLGGGVSASRGLQRVADAVLAQLRWMVPAGQQAVRTPQLARLLALLALELQTAAPATRVAPPELFSAAAAATDARAALRDWLHAAAPAAPG